MTKLFSLIATVLLLVNPVWCVFDYEIFNVDWQYTVLGRIIPETTVFLQSQSQTVQFLTEEGIFAKLNLTNGEPLWRYQSEKPYSSAHLTVVGQLTYTAVNYVDGKGSRIASWQFDNSLLREIDLDASTVGILNIRNQELLAVTSEGDVLFVPKTGDVIELSTGISGVKNALVSLLPSGDVILALDVVGSKTTVVVLTKTNGEYLLGSKFFFPKSFDTLKSLEEGALITTEGVYTFDEAKASFGPVTKVKQVLSVYASSGLVTASGKTISTSTDSHTLEHEVVELKLVNSQFLVAFCKQKTYLFDLDGGLEPFLEFPAVDLKGYDQISATLNDSNDLHVLVQYEDSVITLWSNGVESWSRDESLAKVVDWVIMDEEIDNSEITHNLEFEESATLLHAYIFRAKKNFEKFRNFKFSWSKSDDSMDHYFGFVKTLVVATANGKLFGFSTTSKNDGVKKWDWSFDTHLGSGISKLIVIDDNLLFISTEANGLYFVQDHTSFSIDFAMSSDEPVLSPSFKERITSLKTSAGDIQLILDEADLPLNFVEKTSDNSILGSELSKLKEQSSTWKFNFNDDEKILSIVPRPKTNEDIASTGVVLGNRKVLYKYLEPNLVVVTTYDQSHQVLYLYLINSVSGQVLYTTKQTEPLDVDSVQVIYDENFVVYSYYSLEYGTKIVVIDLFESLTPDVRYSNGNASLEFTPEVSSLGFVINGKIRALIPTSTKYSITSKSIIISLENGQIASVPKFVLNSRRVTDRELTKDEKEEFQMMPYGPVIGIADHFYLSHYRTLLHSFEKPAKVLSSVPTNLESTSIICSVDLDIFCTRVAPSNTFDMLSPSFDRSFLLLTIFALVIAVLVVKPMVNAKRLKAAWVF